MLKRFSLLPRGNSGNGSRQRPRISVVLLTGAASGGGEEP